MPGSSVRGDCPKIMIASPKSRPVPLEGKAMSSNYRGYVHQLSIKRWNWLALGCVQLALGCGFNAAIDGPAAGNPSGTCPIPAEAQAVDTSRPDHIVGTGTPDSCTGDAVVSAVAAGGVITFNCGPDPVTIKLSRTATVTNSSPRVVLDGGSKVALSGDGKVRILSLNTCDPTQNWPSSYCQDQTGPELTVQNLTFVDGNTNGQDLNGGGAILASGGRLKVSRSRFFRNMNYDGDWMGGGGAVRALHQSGGQPVYIVTSTFGGQEGLGNRALSGGALSGVEVPFVVVNSLFTDNQAVAYPMVGAGGAIYDLHAPALSLCGVQMTDNSSTGAGGAIWFVGETAQSVLGIDSSTLRNNHDAMPGGQYPGVMAMGTVVPQASTIQ